MKVDKVTDVEKLFQQAFSDGIMTRELRLSDIEKKYLLDRYPNLKMNKMDNDIPSEKEWYEVSIENS